MNRLGIWMLILGVGALVLPMIGYQFTLMSVFGDYTPFAAIGMIGVGGVVTFAGAFGKNG